MYAQAVPSSPTVSTSPSPAAPASPSRPSRLRGLSYLRSYTQQHLSLHSQQSQPSSSSSAPSARPNTLIRSTTYPTEVILSNEDSPAGPVSPASPPGDWPRESIGSSAIPIPSTHARQESVEASQEDVAPTSSSGGISRIMARHRGGNNLLSSRRGHSVPANSSGPEVRNDTRSKAATGTSASDAPAPNVTRETSGLAGLPQDKMPTIKFIPHQDIRAGKPSLTFATTSRTLPHEDCVIRVGRYSERDGNPNPPSNAPSSAPVGFKSKVVSRRHCELWCSQGQWYIKDVRSSSGTFLNHIRLSQPSVESRPFPVNDGDIVQLGIDFRGGEEMIFRCVKIRIECNRSWQKSLNNFNVQTHKQLRALGKSDANVDSDAASSRSECSICLIAISPCQSLFVAPCSHVWHYKCIRPILNDHKTWPQFLCPNCRAMADLEADIDEMVDLEDWDDNDEELGSNPDENAPTSLTPPAQDDELNAESESDLAESARHLSVASLAKVSNLSTLPNHRSNLRLPQGAVSAANLDATRRHHPNRGPAHWAGNDVDDGLQESGRGIPRSSMYLRPNTPTINDILTTEGPLTPRNDAGPFVFDGSAGRASGRRMMGGVTDPANEHA